MTELQKDQIAAFLQELTALTRKHKIAIGGCGCCGSPFLCGTELLNGLYEVYGPNGDNLEYVKLEDAGTDEVYDE